MAQARVTGGRRAARILKEGSSGAAVVRLQTKLKKVGFNPGRIDGDFGPATRAALIGFQKSAGLLADGIAGPRTLKALGLAAKDSLPSVIPGVTVTVVSKMFPQTQVDNIRTNLPFVLKGLVERALGDKPMVLMALATIRAESESFQPIGEWLSKYNTSPGGHPFDLYDFRSDLGIRARATAPSIAAGATFNSPAVSTIRNTAPRSAWVANSRPRRNWPTIRPSPANS